jgi:hypothetical protein
VKPGAGFHLQSEHSNGNENISINSGAWSLRLLLHFIATANGDDLLVRKKAARFLIFTAIRRLRPDHDRKAGPDSSG